MTHILYNLHTAHLNLIEYDMQTMRCELDNELYSAHQYLPSPGKMTFLSTAGNREFSFTVEPTGSREWYDMVDAETNAPDTGPRRHMIRLR
jgi:hypothetical protein